MTVVRCCSATPWRSPRQSWPTQACHAPAPAAVAPPHQAVRRPVLCQPCHPWQGGLRSVWCGAAGSRRMWPPLTRWESGHHRGCILLMMVPLYDSSHTHTHTHTCTHTLTHITDCTDCTDCPSPINKHTHMHTHGQCLLVRVWCTAASSLRSMPRACLPALHTSPPHCSRAAGWLSGELSLFLGAHVAQQPAAFPSCLLCRRCLEGLAHQQQPQQQG